MNLNLNFPQHRRLLRGLPPINSLLNLREPPYRGLPLREARNLLQKIRACRMEFDDYIEHALEFQRVDESERRWHRNLEMALSLLEQAKHRSLVLQAYIRPLLEDERPNQHVLRRQLHRVERQVDRRQEEIRQERYVRRERRMYMEERQTQERDLQPRPQRVYLVRLVTPERQIANPERQIAPPEPGNAQEPRDVQLLAPLPEYFQMHMSDDEMNVVFTNDDDSVLFNIIHRNGVECVVCGIEVQALLNNNKLLESNCLNHFHNICLSCIIKWINRCYNQQIDVTCPTCRFILLKSLD